MAQNVIGEVFAALGYRFLQSMPREAATYYKYYQEGFHVVLVVEQREGYTLTPEQHDAMVERVMGSFYHPQGFLSDFPDGFPVYHVEVLTLLVVDMAEQARQLCSQCRNVWAYLPTTARLLVYEDQPGEFFGLREALEREMPVGATGEGSAGATPVRVRFHQLPYVTVALVAINVLVYLVLEFLGDTWDGEFIAFHGGMYPPYLYRDHQWWRLFTAGFVHFGADHLVNNMIILFFMGERMEKAVGHLRMLVIYLISLLGGSLLSYRMMLYMGDYAVSAGASGAVFGVIGGFLWVVILHRGRMEDITIKRLLFMIALSIYYGFTSSGVDSWGHIGGVVTGFVVSAILYHRKLQKY